MTIKTLILAAAAVGAIAAPLAVPAAASAQDFGYGPGGYHREWRGYGGGYGWRGGWGGRRYWGGYGYRGYAPRWGYGYHRGW